MPEVNEHLLSSQWRNTIRRESPKQVAAAIRSYATSEVVVDTVWKPDVRNVICWLGPAAIIDNDDIHVARLMAAAPELLKIVVELAAYLELSKVNLTPHVQMIQDAYSAIEKAGYYRGGFDVHPDSIMANILAKHGG